MWFDRGGAVARNDHRELLAIGDRGDPPFGENLFDDADLRSIGMMAYLGSEAEPAVPVLINSLKETNLAFVFNAATSLGLLRLRQDLTLPALTNLLTSPSFGVRNVGVYGLDYFSSRRTRVGKLIVTLLC